MQDGLSEPTRRALIAYGIALLARQLGQPLPVDGPLQSLLQDDDPEATAALTWARFQIDDTASLQAPPAPRPLRSIFSLIAFDDDRRYRSERVDVPLRPLEARLDIGASISSDEIWRRFAADAARLPTGAGQFASFSALIDRYGAAVPGSLEASGVPLAEQFRLITALTAVQPAQGSDVLLVEGDLSGIQELLYTITSRGAAKNLRGRSLY